VHPPHSKASFPERVFSPSRPYSQAPNFEGAALAFRLPGPCKRLAPAPQGLFYRNDFKTPPFFSPLRLVSFFLMKGVEFLSFILTSFLRFFFPPHLSLLFLHDDFLLFTLFRCFFGGVSFSPPFFFVQCFSPSGTGVLIELSPLRCFFLAGPLGNLAEVSLLCVSLFTLRLSFPTLNGCPVGAPPFGLSFFPLRFLSFAHFYFLEKKRTPPHPSPDVPPLNFFFFSFFPVSSCIPMFSIYIPPRQLDALVEPFFDFFLFLVEDGPYSRLFPRFTCFSIVQTPLFSEEKPPFFLLSLGRPLVFSPFGPVFPISKAWFFFSRGLPSPFPAHFFVFHQGFEYPSRGCTGFVSIGRPGFPFFSKLGIFLCAVLCPLLCDSPPLPPAPSFFI